MARDWHEVFITADGDAPPPRPPASRTEAPQRRGFFRRLRENMGKTRQALQAEVQATLFLELNDETWERLEEALIGADVGARTTAQVVEQLELEAEAGEPVGRRGAHRPPRRAARRASRAPARTASTCARDPTVILVVGVNGTGKTTTIGKVAWHLRHELGPQRGDRRRRHLPGGGGRAARDVGAARRGGLRQRRRRTATRARWPSTRSRAARERGSDVVIVDTAGRLHTQHNLMEELAKVRRVIAKQLPDAPHETLLTIDATTGQNGVRQAKLFSEAVDVSGIVLTKLDGTAKGGIALAIADELGIPVKLIGIGETLEDLRPFDADDFARALLDAVAGWRSRRTSARGRLGPLADRGVSPSGWARCSRSASSSRRSPPARCSPRSRRSSAPAERVQLVVFLVASVARAARRAADRALAPAACRRSCARAPRALIGKRAIVLERIANDEGVGCVKIEGEVWTARAYDEDDVYDVGQRVEVVEIRGATALVTE